MRKNGELVEILIIVGVTQIYGGEEVEGKKG